MFDICLISFCNKLKKKFVLKDYLNIIKDRKFYFIVQIKNFKMNSWFKFKNLNYAFYFRKLKKKMILPINYNFLKLNETYFCFSNNDVVLDDLIVLDFLKNTKNFVGIYLIGLRWFNLILNCDLIEYLLKIKNNIYLFLVCYLNSINLSIFCTNIFLFSLNNANN